MRRVLTVLLLGWAGVASAFDSTAWLAKRALLEDEALRLRVAYSNCLPRVSKPAENINVPLETFPDGSVKTSVHADRAVYFLDSGLIWARGVTIRKVNHDGTENARIDAHSCVVDRASKSGWAEGLARVTHGTTTFVGKGIYFSSPEGYVMVMEDSDVKASDTKFGGFAP